ncbi:GNAT family N-acetyltransferase [Tritonibacter scottomollicae]|uniref:GNAT family N-acetyltransferase n=1 Tax=Tritonibacter scottomollicae TaxID=483013 RepID=A0ABZ0HGJ8_TRISK|nr:GNAT family N-acetyltransferase [Tritonibacter scottomollicae]WOI33943.1 GNAT family N-acetyltransferase [Tritonibacter scottomollicae]
MFDLGSADVMPRPIQRSPLARTLAQSSEFTRALRCAGQDVMVLDRMQDMVVLRRRIWGMLIAMINRADLVAPARLLEILQEEGLRRTPVILSPERPVSDLARLGALPLMTPASVGQLDILPCRDAQRAGLEQKWRNRLVHAEGSSLRITRQNMPLKYDHWLLQADAAQQVKRRYRSWPAALTLAYAKANRGCAKLFEAHEGRETVAGILVLTHGDGATYHIAHSLDRGRALSAHNLLIWQAMNWLADKGIRQLDLGVLNTEDASGLARFKLGTGARVERLGGTWVYWPPLGRRLAPLAALDRKLMGI